jgi:DNA polymerase-4
MKVIRKIIHVDMDAFYASIEQRDNPHLCNRPVVVGGPAHSRGVVATASYEARKYGIRSAMPCSQAYRLCPHAIFVPPRFEVYKEVSQQIQRIFHCYTDLVEPLALDEAYLDVTLNKYNEPLATPLAQRIQQQICAETGLTASAGVSFNKFLSKLASAWTKPHGLTIITPEHAQALVDHLPIHKFYGVGKATLKKMQELRIQCGADLKRLGPISLHKHFGKMGDFLYRLAICQDHREVNPHRVRKSIGKETTFSEDIDSVDKLNEAIEDICKRLETSLIKHEQKGRTITLKVRYGDFKTVTRSHTAIHPITLAKELLDISQVLLGKTEALQRPVRLIGISISAFSNSPQLELIK